MRKALLSLLLIVLPFGLAWGQPQLTLNSATDRALYPENSRNQIYLEVHIGSSKQNPAPETAPAPVRNIAFVLDRSGSMAGAPIQALRQAVSATLNALTDRDIVSVVLFGSEVETLIEAKRRDQIGDLDTLLAQIEPGGGSALYDALNQGAAQLRRYAGSATLNHLVLVTDGPATKGPREADDFFRLAEVFAREGITLSTIGLSQDFNEDLLAALARIGHGHFHYVDQPGKLVDALQAEIAPLRTLAARDAVLSIEFVPDCKKVETYGWIPGELKANTATYHFPFVFTDQDLSVLVSAEMRDRRFAYNVATLRLQWKSADDGATHELTKLVQISLVNDERLSRESTDSAVVRTTVNTLISEGMQQAIEEIDKGDFRRALRALRGALQDARGLNYPLDDPQIEAKIKQLEVYLAEVQARGLTQLDRKILRSGLFNQFQTPTADDQPDR